VVDELLARAPHEVLPTPERLCGFRHGERVVVHGAGLVAGYFGIFKHPVDGGYAVIDQDWLGRVVQVKVRLDELTKAERRTKRRRHRRRGRASPRNAADELVLS
jgi:hypothetical protein